MVGGGNEERMILSDQQKEENFQEYLRLRQDPNYYDVTFDDKSGGVSAIHREHRFDSSMGLYGIKKGDYERLVVKALVKRGHVVRLESELAPEGVKSPDGSLDGTIMDIKTVERNGKWAIKDKIHIATKQGVECIVFYFHKASLFSFERLEDGWAKFLNDIDSQRYPNTIKQVLCVVVDEVIEWDIPNKKAAEAAF